MLPVEPGSPSAPPVERAEVERLRVELDRALADNAALRARLAVAPAPDPRAGEAAVLRRWIGGALSVFFLAVAFVLGLWVADRFGREAVRGFRDGYGWSEAGRERPAAPPPVVAPAPAPVPPPPLPPPERHP